MGKRIDDGFVHQRGLRIDRQHAQELINLYGNHTQSEYCRAHDLLLINYAHVVMLYEQKIISRGDACQILKAIKKLETSGVEKTVHLDLRVGDMSTHVVS